MQQRGYRRRRQQQQQEQRQCQMCVCMCVCVCVSSALFHLWCRHHYDNHNNVFLLLLVLLLLPSLTLPPYGHPLARRRCNIRRCKHLFHTT